MRRLSPLPLLLLLSLNGGCKLVAEYGALPTDEIDASSAGDATVDVTVDVPALVSDAYLPSMDIAATDADGAFVDADATSTNGGPPLVVMGDPVPLGRGHSPVITVHQGNYFVAHIGPSALDLRQIPPDAGDVTAITALQGRARTPDIISHGGELFVAWIAEDDLGDAIGLRVSRNGEQPTSVAGSDNYDNPRFFVAANNTLHLVGSLNVGESACTTHMKMMQASYRGSAWQALTVYPPEYGWSAFHPLPLACVGTCAPEVHGLLWLHSPDGDAADGRGDRSVLQSNSLVALRFTPAPLPAVDTGSLNEAKNHLEIGSHPYDCTTPYLPRRRPTALHSDDKIFVAWSNWQPGKAGTGVTLSVVSPGSPMQLGASELVSADSYFPQLLVPHYVGSATRSRLLLYVKVGDGGAHQIEARFFDAQGSPSGVPIRFWTSLNGFAIQSLAAAALGDGRIGVVFSEENTRSGAVTPERTATFLQVRLDWTQL